MGLAGRVTNFQRWLLQRSYRDNLAPNERLVAASLSMGDRDYWFVTDLALYVFPTPSRRNRFDTDAKSWRIPLGAITSCEVIDRGTFRERHVTVLHDEDEFHLTSSYDGPSGRTVDIALETAVRGNQAG